MEHMRLCLDRHAIRSSVTDDPRLNGVGQGLEDLYAAQLAEPLPEAWGRLAALATGVQETEEDTD
jgi:hypothetical protein